MRKAIYIPSRHQTLIEQAAKVLSQIAGGATAIPDGVGYWVDPQGSLVREPITYLWTACDDATAAAVDQALWPVVTSLWTEGEQSVMVEEGSTPTFHERPSDWNITPLRPRALAPRGAA